MPPVLCRNNDPGQECRPISLQTSHMFLYPLGYFPDASLQSDLYQFWSGKRCWPFPLPIVFYPAFREKAAKTRYLFLALPGNYDAEQFMELRKHFPDDLSIFYFRHSGKVPTSFTGFSYEPLLQAHRDADVEFDQYTFNSKIRRDAYILEEDCHDFELYNWGDIENPEKFETIPYTKWGALQGPKKCEIVKMVLSKTTDFTGHRVLFVADVQQVTNLAPGKNMLPDYTIIRPPLQYINWHIRTPLEECVPESIAAFFMKQCETYMCKYGFYLKERQRWVNQFEMFRMRMGEVISISTGENFGIDHHFREKCAKEAGLSEQEVWVKVPSMSLDLLRANVIEGAFDIVIAFYQYNATYRSYISEKDKTLLLKVARRVIMFE